MLRLLLTSLVLGALLPFACQGATGPEEMESGLRSMNSRNYAEAFASFERALSDKDFGGFEAAKAYSAAVDCLNRLSRQEELDPFWSKHVGLRADDWRFLTKVAQVRFLPNGGIVHDGAFHRGSRHYRSGRWLHVEYHDCIRSLRLLTGVMDKVEGPDSWVFYDALANVLNELSGNYLFDFRLHLLTDLSVAPDYLNEALRGEGSEGIPVDGEDGFLVFRLRKTWQECKNDGERYLWALQKQVEVGDVSQSRWTRYKMAEWFSQVYDAADGWTSGMSTGDLRELSTAPQLADDESVLWLATGPRRVKLPPEVAFIGMYKSLYNEFKGVDRALEQVIARTLSKIYMKRCQYEQALEWYDAFRAAGGGELEEAKQLLGSWCSFKPVRPQVAGSPVTVQLAYRNATKATCWIRKLDALKIKEDFEAKCQDVTIKGNRYHYYYDLSIEGLVRAVPDWDKKYLGDEVARWDVALSPKSGRFCTESTLTTPLREAGWYVMYCRVAGGNEVRIVLNVRSVLLVASPLIESEAGLLIQVLQAASGRPVPGEELEFFGFRRCWNDKTKTVRSEVNRQKAKTDSEGKVVVPREAFKFKPMEKGEWQETGQWLVGLHRGGSDFTWINLGSMPGYGRPLGNRKIKAFFLSDRPVYRPGQVVKFKFWLGSTDYQSSGFDLGLRTGKHCVVITDARGEKVTELDLKRDAYNGVSGEYALKPGCSLGTYSLQLDSRHYGSFRVEEYKKPEYEVVVKAPTHGPLLGEAFSFNVEAKYYFGAPVTDADVSVKVLRIARQATWWPVRPWDWCYGPGYWWYWGDYDWYPGWERWGKCRPVHPWMVYRRYQPPEVVLQQKMKLDGQGRLTVNVDTASAKKNFGDRDHEYKIEVEVTDSSRRTIVGNGSVMVARQPFEAHLWLDRGYGEVGKPIGVSVQGRTLSGEPVSGSGRLTLYRIVRGADGELKELVEREWDLGADKDGKGRQTISASRAGQYRLGWELTDSKGRKVEAGLLFTIIGPGFDGRDFEYKGLELIADKAEYAPGETVRLLVNAEKSDATVMLSPRSENGCITIPQVISLGGKSRVVEIPVVAGDMPNFFIDAYCVMDGVVHRTVCQVAVPPVKKVLDVEVVSASSKLKPGERGSVRIRLRDLAGKAYRGSIAVSVYDKSVEYISGGSNIGSIKEFFWKWVRYHNMGSTYGWDRLFMPIYLEDEPRMWMFLSPLEPFLAGIEDEEEDSHAYMMRSRRTSGLQRARSGNRRENDAADGGMGMAMAKAARPAAAPVLAAEMKSDAMALGAGMDEAGGGGAEGITIRKEFADTALWIASLETDENGETTIQVPMPENLTTWKVKVWAMGSGTSVGEGSTELITTKDLLIRMQAPRFFVERDQVVLSAIVHNYLPSGKEVSVELDVDEGILRCLDGRVRRVKVSSGGEARIDWRVQVVSSGEAVVRMTAKSDADSDGMEQRFPVLVHGISKLVSSSGSLKPEETECTVTLNVPKERREESTQLVVRWSPSLALAMVDALPYLAEYPHGCTEQTLNRFLPAVQARAMLRDLGLSLEDVKEAKANLNAQELGDADERKAQWQKNKLKNPVFDDDELDAMVAKGVRDLLAMQCSDGGWGWFSGFGERSWCHTTAQVLRGLNTAKAYGVKVDEGALMRGKAWMTGRVDEQLRRFKLKKDDRDYRSRADNLDALAYCVLAEVGEKSPRMSELGAILYRDKAGLSQYGLSLFGLGLHILGERTMLEDVLKNLRQYVMVDSENQTALIETGGWWWYWYGDSIETQAAYLKLLVATEPKGDLAPMFVKYLLNNRKHATYWNSTRDTAACLDAFTAYLKATGETKPDMAVEVLLDGKPIGGERIDAKSIFTSALACQVSGEALGAGSHTLTIRKTGRGPLYFTTALSYFSLEERIGKAGLEVKVERRIWRLVRKDAEVSTSGAEGQIVGKRLERYERTALSYDDTVNSGDLLEVELLLESKNDYEYLMLEDMKAAGTEAVELRSGYSFAGGLGAHMEYRDKCVMMYFRQLPRGRHSLSYRLRAEIPGVFNALPTTVTGMYAPELRGNSDEMRFGIGERPVE
ncbi:MAG: alpha-2-macroglobulin [Lentisphaerae bacterium]|jgi:uncharacterized protein YfaS (alpha-2-macroglobulin family)|nr:alpha-2-macroglobulin [Lentisphaerota bacterium]